MSTNTNLKFISAHFENKPPQNNPIYGPGHSYLQIIY